MVGLGRAASVADDDDAVGPPGGSEDGPPTGVDAGAAVPRGVEATERSIVAVEFALVVLAGPIGPSFIWSLGMAPGAWPSACCRAKLWK